MATVSARPGCRRALMLLAGVLIAGLGLTATLSAGAEAAKKKGAAKSKVFNATAFPNFAIPDAPAMGASTPVTSIITIGKKFKGEVVGDLNVTGVQTTGSGLGAANDLTAYLTAPNGLTVDVFQNIGDRSIGPLTI